MNLLNLFKKVTAIIVVFIVFFKVFVLEIYALSAAPIAAEALIEVFGTLLVASGVNTQSEVDEMSWGEVSSNVKNGLSSGAINPADVIVDVTLDGVETKMNFMDWLASGSKDVYLVFTMGLLPAKQQWIDSLTADDVVPSYPDIDMSGYSAMLEAKKSNGNVVVRCYCEYLLFEDGAYFPRGERYQICSVKGGEWFEQSNHSYSFSEYADISVYGDVRLTDGTEVPVVGAVPEIGETADGESVTLDEVQSGEVALDDVALDYDKFDDEAIIKLLEQILSELDNTPVVEDDTSTYDDAKENIQATVGELDIAEFNNLQMPIGILDVFPFCLPFDFVRGMKLLVAEPEVPVFKTVIDFGEINGWDLGEYPVEISFEKWEPVAIVTRWTSLLLFSYVLIFVSTKIVKGAGS